MTVIEALYHHEKGRLFRPTVTELETGQYTCPYCGPKFTLKKIVLRHGQDGKEHGYCCPGCFWSIHRDDVWKPEPKQEPVIREPGVEPIDEASPLQPESFGLEDIPPPILTLL